MSEQKTTHSSEGYGVPNTHPHIRGIPPHVEGKLCPVCQGCGLVPPGFYDQHAPTSNTGSAIPMREGCRACGGRGVL